MTLFTDKDGFIGLIVNMVPIKSLFPNTAWTQGMLAYLQPGVLAANSAFLFADLFNGAIYRVADVTDRKVKEKTLLATEPTYSIKPFSCEVEPAAEPALIQAVDVFRIPHHDALKGKPGVTPPLAEGVPFRDHGFLSF